MGHTKWNSTCHRGSRFTWIVAIVEICYSDQAPGESWIVLGNFPIQNGPSIITSLVFCFLSSSISFYSPAIIHSRNICWAPTLSYLTFHNMWNCLCVGEEGTVLNDNHFLATQKFFYHMYDFVSMTDVSRFTNSRLVVHSWIVFPCFS